MLQAEFRVTTALHHVSLVILNPNLLRPIPHANWVSLHRTFVVHLNVTFAEEQDVEDSLREDLIVAEDQLLQAEFRVTIVLHHV